MEASAESGAPSVPAPVEVKFNVPPVFWASEASVRVAEPAEAVAL